MNDILKNHIDLERLFDELLNKAEFRTVLKSNMINRLIGVITSKEVITNTIDVEKTYIKKGCIIFYIDSIVSKPRFIGTWHAAEVKEWRYLAIYDITKEEFIKFTALYVKDLSN